MLPMTLASSENCKFRINLPEAQQRCRSDEVVNGSNCEKSAHLLSCIQDEVSSEPQGMTEIRFGISINVPRRRNRRKCYLL